MHISSSDKPIDRMDRLADMAHFPAIVNAGATVNILATLLVTWALVPRYPQVYAPIVWTAIVLILNLSPVILLRAIAFNKAPIPPLSHMDFYRDQHRFSDWVYLAASANMAFWILVSWSIFSVSHAPAILAAVLAVAFLATFSPVLLRPLIR
ncbi:hypothetical protein [Granulicella arctica]|uniref:hypothetical protein n=1 Tax=Granulicella arctica TaxID=940613 RepID=UPI0021DF9AE5|nr:hypothetical protein [Granulicella arctica]